jgi:hypothetical protein
MHENVLLNKTRSPLPSRHGPQSRRRRQARPQGRQGHQARRRQEVRREPPADPPLPRPRLSLSLPLSLSLSLSLSSLPRLTRRRWRRTKDPNAPKRPMSAYFIFSNEARDRVKAANPTFKIGDVRGARVLR